MSAARDLLRELGNLGISVWQEAGALHYRAPAGKVSPELLTRLKACKPDLLAMLGTVAANDPAQTLRFVLTYEVEGRQATCLDPVSPTLEVAIADLGRLYGPRLGRVWCKGALVRDMTRH
ncbi:MAG: TubC N-terminal docking domain [Moraxellaceae bacterium]|jgi:hypothetical protein|nr:TubC N-terminal docking domain [Moraxellaceae bacterium]